MWLIPVFSFCMELIDSALGGGYGTAMTPILLLYGFTPLQIVPSILLSELITGSLAAFFHHRAKNVSFTRHSSATRVAAVLSLFSVIGSVAAVLLIVKLPTKIITLWIGVIVVSMGIIILWKKKENPVFSWPKIIGLGTLASFNKGMSGGGYGPLVTGGQMLAGVKTKNAIAITSLAEALTCLAGVILYFTVDRGSIEWKLTPYLVAGSICAVPLAAVIVKKLPEKTIKTLISILILFLGSLTIYKVIVK
jgi:uncharacterized protein